jgi:hypothetical protein
VILKKEKKEKKSEDQNDVIQDQVRHCMKTTPSSCYHTLVHDLVFTAIPSIHD